MEIDDLKESIILNSEKLIKKYKNKIAMSCRNRNSYLSKIYFWSFSEFGPKTHWDMSGRVPFPVIQRILELPVG